MSIISTFLIPPDMIVKKEVFDLRLSVEAYIGIGHLTLDIITLRLLSFVLLSSQDFSPDYDVSGTMSTNIENSDEKHYRRIMQGGYTSHFFENRGFGWLLDIDDDMVDFQRPLLEELDIDLSDIYYKVRCVLFPLPYFRLKLCIVRESPDFWGPLFIVSTYALLSLYGQLSVLSWILTIWFIGSFFVFFLARALGGEVGYGQVLGIVGYCLIPLVVVGLITSVLSRFRLFSIAVGCFGVLWSVYSAGTLLCVEELREKRTLLLYPKISWDSKGVRAINQLLVVRRTVIKETGVFLLVLLKIDFLTLQDIVGNVLSFDVFEATFRKEIRTYAPGTILITEMYIWHDRLMFCKENLKGSDICRSLKEAQETIPTDNKEILECAWITCLLPKVCQRIDGIVLCVFPNDTVKTKMERLSESASLASQMNQITESILTESVTYISSIPYSPSSSSSLSDTESFPSSGAETKQGLLLTDIVTQIDSKMSEKSFIIKTLPELCWLPAVTGPCSKAKVLWYYNSLRDRCERFSFSGCGNANHFYSREKCEETCLMEYPMIL
uniref:Protein YIPF4 n=1 Tax=Brugia malayi TaxID=6279 RepID=A0A0H5SNE1_BRUMA|nr:Bm6943 [Brugia malayi]